MSESDQLAIRNAVARLAHLADMADDAGLEDYLDMFTEDAIWNMAGAARRGRADIRAGAEARRADGLQGPGSNSRHVITTQAVDVDGDVAVSNAYFLFVTEAGTSPTLTMVGHYTDRFVRQAGRWLLAERTIRTD